MGRRKIEIKAIKDDRNRSVTFLKRKGGLFKKAHELSVLCSVDVAVFIFGNNKKLYEYSSCDMRDLITRYTYHGSPNEHKGPADFNGGDDDDDDDENGTPPQGDGMEHLMPPQLAGQPPYTHIRRHTPSRSPPIQNGMFGPHPGHTMQRTHTPQPPMGSRPSSENEMRRMPPNRASQGPPQPPANGYAFASHPAIFNPPNAPNMAQNLQPGIPPLQPPYTHGPYPPQQPQSQLQSFMDEPRRSSAAIPPSFPAAAPKGPPVLRHSVSPPQPLSQQPPHPPPHMSPPQFHPLPQPVQQPLHRSSPHLSHKSPARLKQDPLPHSPHPPSLPRTEYQPPALMEPNTEHPPEQAQIERVRQPPVLDTGVKKHKGSIFTPIDENRSILSQHLAAFNSDAKPDSSLRSQSEFGRFNANISICSPSQRESLQLMRNCPVVSVPDMIFTAPSRSVSIVASSTAVLSRPRLKVQIPEDSESGSATAESTSSPRNTAATDNTSSQSRRPLESHSSAPLLPPPSPSASALLSAGASGPPNPFARPLPNREPSSNIETPISSLPSRFVNDILPSPGSFLPDWTLRGTDSSHSPLNLATPVAGIGPSFLRDEIMPHKRKTPDKPTSTGHEAIDHANELKRLRAE